VLKNGYSAYPQILKISHNRLIILILRNHAKVRSSIMKEFRSIYREWWDLSKTLTLENTAFSNLKRKKIQTLIFKRDEIRKALVSYLNSKYGKLNA